MIEQQFLVGDPRQANTFYIDDIVRLYQSIKPMRDYDLNRATVIGLREINLLSWKEISAQSAFQQTLVNHEDEPTDEDEQDNTQAQVNSTEEIQQICKNQKKVIFKRVTLQNAQQSCYSLADTASSTLLGQKVFYSHKQFELNWGFLNENKFTDAIARIQADQDNTLLILFTNLRFCKYNTETNTLSDLHSLTHLSQTLVSHLLNPAVRMLLTEHAVVYYHGLH